jgi:hypothetical protein
MQEPERPAFALEFPRTAELDAAVEAFARGDYASVWRLATRLEQASSDQAIVAAARALKRRTLPDPLSVALLAIAALLLLVLGGWWVLFRPPA